MRALRPETSALEAALRAALYPGRQQGTLTVRRRQENPLQSAHTSEIVTLKTGENSSLDVFCKYDDAGFEKPSGSDSILRGVVYEAYVYQELLRSLSVTLPRFYGAFTDERIKINALFVQLLVDAHKVSMERKTMLRAASWLGRFHAVSEERRSDWQSLRLHKYGPEYYRFWSRRTADLAGQALGDDAEWVSEICNKFETAAVPLLLENQTIVHGEFYPSNVLISDGLIKPVDWESTAVAAGEVDLAFLMEGWSAELQTALKG